MRIWVCKLIFGVTGSVGLLGVTVEICRRVSICFCLVCRDVIIPGLSLEVPFDAGNTDLNSKVV